MWKAKLLRISQFLSVWLFWPGLVLVAWGELTPHPPDLGQVLGWDKAEHFIAYFGLAGMATMVLGMGPRLARAIFAIILISGVLEILQGYTGRDPEILDFVVNSIGAFAGLGLGSLMLWWLTPLVGVRTER
jgi:VanZ family protein